MGNNLSVVLAVADADTRQILQCTLIGVGHRVLAVVSTGEELITAVLEHGPDLVIVDITLAGLDALSAIDEFLEHRQAAVIALSGPADQLTIDAVSAHPIQAYITRPITPPNLLAAISIAISRFNEAKALRQEVRNAKRRLSETALVEKAKGILMKVMAMDEEEAFRQIRTMARNSGRTVGEIATNILNAANSLSGKDQLSAVDFK